MSGAMTLPEWAVVLILTGIGVVMWWGVRRLVQTNDNTNSALVEIGQGLATMNGRLGKSETWMELHEKQDDERHQEVKQAHAALWKQLSHTRP